jgi:hypothetical protein
MHHIHYEQRTFWTMCAGDVMTDLMSGFETVLSCIFTNNLRRFSSFHSYSNPVEHKNLVQAQDNLV